MTLDYSEARARWQEAAASHLDALSQRAARSCCFTALGRDLLRYPAPVRQAMMAEFLSDPDTEEAILRILIMDGPEAAAAALEVTLNAQPSHVPSLP